MEKGSDTVNGESEREILEQFIHENADLEKLEEIIDKFNIFTALGVVNNEIRHSNFLSWLLSPNESHGLGDYFLALFLRRVSLKASSPGTQAPSILI